MRITSSRPSVSAAMRPACAMNGWRLIWVFSVRRPQVRPAFSFAMRSIPALAEYCELIKKLAKPGVKGVQLYQSGGRGFTGAA